MVLKKWDDEQATDYTLNAMNSELLSISGLNLIRMLIDRDIDFSVGEFDWWGDAYIDSNGRENSVSTSKNLTGALFDTNKYKVPDFFSETEYIIIEATSMGAWTNGTNDVYVYKIGDGKWIVYCDTGTDAVKRAQIHESLWYGTDGTDQLILDFTTVTSVQTSNANDVGKRAHYGEYKVSSNNNGGACSLVGTFVDTSTNTNSSMWSNINDVSGGGHPTRCYFPTGTLVNSADGVASLEFGTDRSADEDNNPASVTMDTEMTASIDSGDYNKGIVLCKGDITWVETNTTGATVTFLEIDFYTADSIPDMIAAGTLVSEVDYLPIKHAIPSGSFSSTISEVIGVPFVVDWETGADIKYKLTGTSGSEDTGWLDAGITPEISTFTAFTAEPDTLIIQLIPKTTSPTSGYPSIKGFVVRAT